MLACRGGTSRANLGLWNWLRSSYVWKSSPRIMMNDVWGFNKKCRVTKICSNLLNIIHAACLESQRTRTPNLRSKRYAFVKDFFPQNMSKSCTFWEAGGQQWDKIMFWNYSLSTWTKLKTRTISGLSTGIFGHWGCQWLSAELCNHSYATSEGGELKQSPISKSKQSTLWRLNYHANEKQDQRSSDI